MRRNFRRQALLTRTAEEIREEENQLKEAEKQIKLPEPEPEAMSEEPPEVISPVKKRKRRQE